MHKYCTHHYQYIHYYFIWANVIASDYYYCNLVCISFEKVDMAHEEHRQLLESSEGSDPVDESELKLKDEPIEDEVKQKKIENEAQLVPGEDVQLRKDEQKEDDEAQLKLVDSQNEIIELEQKEKVIQDELQLKLAAEFLFQDHKKKDVDIVLVGLTGSGKSSLINTLCRGHVATVGNVQHIAQHQFIEEYLLRYSDTTMHIYDTHGLSDPSVQAKEIFSHMRKELKQIDLLLICHKLYGKVDQLTYEMGNKLHKYCGSEIFDHAIIVLTQADEYKVHIHCDDEANRTEQTKDEFIKRIDSMEKAFQIMLVENLKITTMDCFSKIPICVSSKYQYELPTTRNWESDLWDHIARHCTPEAMLLLGYFARHWLKIKNIFKIRRRQARIQTESCVQSLVESHM